MTSLSAVSVYRVSRFDDLCVVACDQLARVPGWPHISEKSFAFRFIPPTAELPIIPPTIPPTATLRSHKVITLVLHLGYTYAVNSQLLAYPNPRLWTATHNVPDLGSIGAADSLCGVLRNFWDMLPERVII